MDERIVLKLSGSAPALVRHALLRYDTTLDGGLLDDVRLLASELVANAVQHSGRPDGDPITVGVTLSETAIRVEVSDRGAGRTPFAPRSVSPPSGLQLVEEISNRWSSRSNQACHVWFEIDIAVNGNRLLHR